MGASVPPALTRQQKSGRFFNMTSTSGLVGNVGQANYAAAKLRIVGLTRVTALDMARYDVTANCISPFAWTRMIGTHPHGHGSAAGARREDQEDVTGAHRATRSVPRVRRRTKRNSARSSACAARKSCSSVIIAP